MKERNEWMHAWNERNEMKENSEINEMNETNERNERNERSEWNLSEVNEWMDQGMNNEFHLCLFLLFSI